MLTVVLFTPRPKHKHELTYNVFSDVYFQLSHRMYLGVMMVLYVSMIQQNLVKVGVNVTSAVTSRAEGTGAEN